MQLWDKDDLQLKKMKTLKMKMQSMLPPDPVKRKQKIDGARYNSFIAIEN